MGHPPKAKSTTLRPGISTNQPKKKIIIIIRSEINYQNAGKHRGRIKDLSSHPLIRICCCTVWLELQAYLTKPFNVPDTFFGEMFLTAESAGPQDRLGSEWNHIATQRIRLDWIGSHRLESGHAKAKNMI